MTFSPKRTQPLQRQLPIIARCCLILCLLILAACQGPAALPTPVGAGQPLAVASPTFTPSAVPTLTFTAPPSTVVPPPTATPLPMLESPLVWYAQGSAPENAAALTRELNRLLLERGLNARVEVCYIESGLFEQRMAEIRAAGADWDLVSLSGAQYDLWRGQDALLPLGPSTLSGRAAETLAPHPSVLRALYRGGEIYAVPAPVPWAKSRGISIRADVVQALELEDDLYALESFQDLTQLLETIQAAVESGVLQSAGVENADALRGAAGNAAILFPEAGGYSSLWGPLVAPAGAGEDAVVNWYASEAFQQLAALRLEWQQAGFLPEEPLTPDQLAEAYREGRYALEIGQEFFPGSAARQAERYGYTWLDISLTPAWITTDSLLSSVTGLNARLAQDPERALRAALLLKDAYVHDEVRRLMAGLLGWQGELSLEEVYVWNAAAQYAPGMGFVFDPRPVGAEAAALTGSAPEWLEPLQNGQTADIERALKSFHQSLETAGIERIQAELEAQYAAWRSAQQ